MEDRGRPLTWAGQSVGSGARGRGGGAEVVGFALYESRRRLKRAASGVGVRPFPQLWYPPSQAEWDLLSEPDFLGSNPGSATFWLCNLGRVIEPLFASVSSPGR